MLRQIRRYRRNPPPTAHNRSYRTVTFLWSLSSFFNQRPSITSLTLTKMGISPIRTACKVSFDKPASQQPMLHVSPIWRREALPLILLEPMASRQ
jgi:hypothetical protein